MMTTCRPGGLDVNALENQNLHSADFASLRISSADANNKNRKNNNIIKKINKNHHNNAYYNKDPILRPKLDNSIVSASEIKAVPHRLGSRQYSKNQNNFHSNSYSHSHQSHNNQKDPDMVSVLDSAYCPSMYGSSCTGSIKPSDSVSHISSRNANSALLSRRQKLEEPTVPASVRSLASQRSRPGTSSTVVRSAVGRSASASRASHRDPAATARKLISSNSATARSQSLAVSQANQKSIRSACPSAISNNFNIRPDTANTIRTSMSLSTSENVKILEQQIRKKLTGGHVYSLRALFKTNSTEILTSTTGVLSPVVMLTGLAKALCSFLNVNHVSQKECKFLLQRLQLDPSKPIHFEVFYGRIRDGVPLADYPSWLDPAKRRKENFQEYTEALKALKKVSRENLEKVLPNLNGDAITRTDVKRALEYLGFYLNEVNFQKLWEQITLKIGRGSVIPAKRLRIFLKYEQEEVIKEDEKEEPIEQHDKQHVEQAPSEIASSVNSNTLNDKRNMRKLTIEIEKFLKDRFRKAFEALKKTFEEADRAIHHEQITGTLPRSSFRACMSKYGLQLSNDEQLETFLARCGLSKLARERVDYRHFLHTFQDRSEHGNARKILADPKHRFNQALTESIGPRTTVSAVEARLLALFQGEYLSLLGTLHRLDRAHSGRLEPEEFRAAIESTLQTEFQDNEFEDFYYKMCPLDDEGKIKYMKFMSLFDATGKPAASMFPDEARTYVTSFGSFIDGSKAGTDIGNGKNSKSSDLSTEEALRKALLRKRVLLRNEFEKYDALNTGRLSLDGLYSILESANIKPLPNRSDLRKLWKSSKNNFFKRSDETVAFAELERWAELGDGGKMGRHVLPRIPVMGDDDVNLSSKTLSHDLHLLESQVNIATQARIDWVRHQLQLGAWIYFEKDLYVITPVNNFVNNKTNLPPLPTKNGLFPNRLHLPRRIRLPNHRTLPHHLRTRRR